jgi:hypothetical protein
LNTNLQGKHPIESLRSVWKQIKKDVMQDGRTTLKETDKAIREDRNKSPGLAGTESHIKIKMLKEEE